MFSKLHSHRFCWWSALNFLRWLILDMRLVVSAVSVFLQALTYTESVSCAVIVSYRCGKLIVCAGYGMVLVCGWCIIPHSISYLCGWISECAGCSALIVCARCVTLIVYAGYGTLIMCAGCGTVIMCAGCGTLIMCAGYIISYSIFLPLWIGLWVVPGVARWLRVVPGVAPWLCVLGVYHIVFLTSVGGSELCRVWHADYVCWVYIT